MSAGGVDGWREQAQERREAEERAGKNKPQKDVPKSTSKASTGSKTRLCARALANALPEDAGTPEGLALWLVTDGADYVIELAEALQAGRSK